MDVVELFGNETRKALANFGENRLPRELIKAYCEVKKASLKAINEYEKRFEPLVFESVMEATDLIMEGFYDSQFPLSLKQGGAGTSINMNFNEVIANLASKIHKEKYSVTAEIDPIEDINRYQSTNDTFPTVVTIVVLRKLQKLELSVVELQETLIKKETEYANILLTGRTEMQDALPITLGQVFAGWAGSIERDRWRLNKLKERVRTIALGGTAIGTCFFAPKEYVFLAEKHLRSITGLSLSRSQNLTDEISNLDKYSELANGIKLVAENLFKITSDFMLYTSSLSGELKHPDLQYGSTIMAAKTNPVILEYVKGISIGVQAECSKISVYSQSGQLQLNPYLPFVLESFLTAFQDIENAINSFIYKFINKLEINLKRIEYNLVHSKILLNALVPLVGYNMVKKLYEEFKDLNISTMDDFKNILKEKPDFSNEDIDFYLDPVNLTSYLKRKV